jgi:hypothetical protein
MNNNELLDDMGNDVETCGEPYDEMEGNKKSTLAVHSEVRQRMNVLGSFQFISALLSLLVPDIC